MKYGKEDGFNDPVVRCCDCSLMFSRKKLRDSGGCPKCGNKRVRNCLALSGEEMQTLKDKNYDPEFLALFEGKQEDVI